MESMFGKLLYLFDSRTKVIASLLLAMILLGTLLEMFGIGAILPLITLFSVPDPLEANSFLKQAFCTESTVQNRISLVSSLSEQSLSISYEI